MPSQVVELSSRFGIPELQHAVLKSQNDTFTVRGVCTALHRPPKIPCEDGDLFSRLGVPELQGLVARSRHNALSVRGTSTGHDMIGERYKGRVGVLWLIHP